MATEISPLTETAARYVLDFRRWVGAFPPLTLFLFLAPITVGLAGTVLPSLSYLPGVGAARLDVEPWRDLLRAPGFAQAVSVTLLTGFGATLIALLLAVAVTAAWHGTEVSRRLRAWLAPLLAAPHAAFALGFAFLFAPSGWVVRLVSPWLTGWERPPDFIFVQDPNGFALLIALVCKEVFFLLLMIWAALGQVRADKLMYVAGTLGYRRVAAWCKVVLPLVYGQIRLPVYAVLAYSLSVVDMAIILGPTAPSTLSVLTLNWFQDPNPIVQLQGAAGAVALLFCVILAISLWRLVEIVLSKVMRGWLVRGVRAFAEVGIRWVSGLAMAVVFAVMMGALLSLVIWSATNVWRFPDSIPDQFSLVTWKDSWPALIDHLVVTAVLAAMTATIAVVIVLGCLENESWNRVTAPKRSLAFLYLPLVIPQISFLFGLQVIFVALSADGTFGVVVLSHLIFVLPYVYLVLSDPYRALDPKYARTASSLGVSPFYVFWRVRAPLLLGAIAVAFAVGFAVSVTQYLATLFPSSGRLSTLTTEAVILSTGGDRRIAAVYGLSQFVLPLLVFAFATVLSSRREKRIQGIYR